MKSRVGPQRCKELTSLSMLFGIDYGKDIVRVTRAEGLVPGMLEKATTDAMDLLVYFGRRDVYLVRCDTDNWSVSLMKFMYVV